jgi:hypothetical protein
MNMVIGEFWLAVDLDSLISPQLQAVDLQDVKRGPRLAISPAIFRVSVSWPLEQRPAD